MSSLLAHLDDAECRAFVRAAHAFAGFVPDTDVAAQHELCGARPEPGDINAADAYTYTTGRSRGRWGGRDL